MNSEHDHDHHDQPNAGRRARHATIALRRLLDLPTDLERELRDVLATLEGDDDGSAT